MSPSSSALFTDLQRPLNFLINSEFSLHFLTGLTYRPLLLVLCQLLSGPPLVKGGRSSQCASVFVTKYLASVGPLSTFCFTVVFMGPFSSPCQPSSVRLDPFSLLAKSFRSPSGPSVFSRATLTGFPPTIVTFPLPSCSRPQRSQPSLQSQSVALHPPTLQGHPLTRLFLS